MTVGYIGYLSSFNSFTIADQATKIALLEETPIGNGVDVIDRMQRLANGTIVDYDGTSTSDFNYAEIRQVVLVTSSGRTYYNSAQAQKGVSATLTKTTITSGSETASARCMDVRLMPNSWIGADIIYVEWTFQLKGAWS